MLDSEADYFFLEPTSQLDTHRLDSPLVAQLPSGTVVSVSGTAEIMAYYEVDGYSPPLVTDRTVHDLAVERRALVPETDNVNVSHPGEIISVETIARMRKTGRRPVIPLRARYLPPAARSPPLKPGR